MSALTDFLANLSGSPVMAERAGKGYGGTYGRVKAADMTVSHDPSLSTIAYFAADAWADWMRQWALPATPAPQRREDRVILQRSVQEFSLAFMDAFRVAFTAGLARIDAEERAAREAIVAGPPARPATAQAAALSAFAKAAVKLMPGH